MRLLLATDGSAGAQVAADLVAGLPWPEDTIVDVVRVLDTLASNWASAPTPDLHISYERLVSEARQTVDQTARRMRSYGLRSAGFVLNGPEVPSLVDQATDTGVDMVVCGSRGRGHLRSVMLGSVSAGVAAGAPCSVLVARHPTVTKVILAVDGSPSATAAEHVAMTLPMFANPSLDLITVTGPPFGSEDDWQTHVRLVGQLQHSAGDRLRGAGRDAREVLLTGRPAPEIVAQAAESGADLIVLGAHAQSGLDRLLLGSTTLEVLTHSHASVMVARESTLGSSAMTSAVGRDRAHA